MADSLVQNNVNGLLVDSPSTEITELVDPVTGEVTGWSPKSTPEEVDEAVRAAEAALAEWRRTIPSQRQSALLELAGAIEADADELVEVQSPGTGQITSLIRSEKVPVGKIGSAIAAGDTVVLEPSDTTPESTVLLVELAGEFLPPGGTPVKHVMNSLE